MTVPRSPRSLNRTNMAVKFFPRTSFAAVCAQLCDESKSVCRKRPLTSLVANSDNFQSIIAFSKSVNVLDGLLCIADAVG
jgi:hypothetical protein